MQCRGLYISEVLFAKIFSDSKIYNEIVKSPSIMAVSIDSLIHGINGRDPFADN